MSLIRARAGCGREPPLRAQHSTASQPDARARASGPGDTVVPRVGALLDLFDIADGCNNVARH
jgi:hypothetical protein